MAPGSIFAGRYLVGPLLSAGGHGAVYEVVDRRNERIRALKVVLGQHLRDPAVVERFRREAIVTAKIESEHLVEVLDAGVDEATQIPFIVMERLRGLDLADRVDRAGPVPPADVVVYLRQAAVAIDRAHEHGILHRDLKPENLFLTTRDDGSPRVRVFDFGIAKILDGTSAVNTQVIGTPLYMSPEQLRADARLTGATDVFALGHIAFTLLVGKPYWFEESKLPVHALLLRLLTTELEPATVRAHKLGAELPPGFDAWFARACAHEATARFRTAGDAADSLSRVFEPMLSLAEDSTVLGARVVVVPAARTVAAPDGEPIAAPGAGPGPAAAPRWVSDLGAESTEASNTERVSAVVDEETDVGPSPAAAEVTAAESDSAEVTTLIGRLPSPMPPPIPDALTDEDSATRVAQIVVPRAMVHHRPPLHRPRPVTRLSSSYEEDDESDDGEATSTATQVSRLRRGEDPVRRVTPATLTTDAAAAPHHTPAPRSPVVVGALAGAAVVLFGALVLWPRSGAPTDAAPGVAPASSAPAIAHRSASVTSFAGAPPRAPASVAASADPVATPSGLGARPAPVAPSSQPRVRPSAPAPPSPAPATPVTAADYPETSSPTPAASSPPPVAAPSAPGVAAP